MKKEREGLLGELERYKVCDPQVLRELQVKTKVAVDSANRWTGEAPPTCGHGSMIYNYVYLLLENVFSIKSWCRNKFNIEEDVINKQFSIPEDLDYVS